MFHVWFVEKQILVGVVSDNNYLVASCVRLDTVYEVILTASFMVNDYWDMRSFI